MGDERADLLAVGLAYLLIASVWLVFVFIIWRRLSGAGRRIDRAEAALRSKTQAHFVD
jgi:hypothetical protein